jgi:hypothetical protein
MWFSNGQSNGSNGSNGHGRNQNNVCVANGKKNLAKSWPLALSQDSFVGFSPRSSHSSPFSIDFPPILAGSCWPTSEGSNSWRTVTATQSPP